MLNLAGTISESYVDGEGIRYVIFVQGCPHHCVQCHNQKTWEFKPNISKSIKEILEEIKQNPLLEGVTFSGGEPFTQCEELTLLATEIHKLNLTVWCYTGYKYEELLKEPYINLLKNINILVDGKFDINKKSLNLLFRGSSNQRIIDVQTSLKNNKIIEKYDF